MFHLFTGKCTSYANKKYLQNQYFGIQVNYLGTQSEGMFFLYPYMDDNKKTIVYYAFDTADQKVLFENMLKISGIGPKTAFQIVQLPKDSLQTALKTVDVKFFQSIPGIGPKSAKKILLELKGSIDMNDFEKINVDEKLYKNIVKSLKNFGYESSKVKEILQKYEGKITPDNMSEVIKRVIQNM
ncbi:MAG: Holliday junction branch migration protein RuvA [Candidatus Absconditabacterales bacterium]